MRSGYVVTFSDYLSYTGIAGYNWPSTATSTYSTGTDMPSAFLLKMNAASVSTSYGPRDRRFAFPLRCLAYTE